MSNTIEDDNKEYSKIKNIINQICLSVSILTLNIYIPYTEISRKKIEYFKLRLERDFVSVKFNEHHASIELHDEECNGEDYHLFD